MPRKKEPPPTRRIAPTRKILINPSQRIAKYYSILFLEEERIANSKKKSNSHLLLIKTNKEGLITNSYFSVF